MISALIHGALGKLLLPLAGTISSALSPQCAVWGNRFELLAYPLVPSLSQVGDSGSGGTLLLPVSSGGSGTAAGLPAHPEGAEQVAE